MARRRRRPPAGLIYHSDRETQYASNAFQSLLRQHGVQRSLNAKGNGFDNTAMESFFALLKRERYLTRKQARTDIFGYIAILDIVSHEFILNQRIRVEKSPPLRGLFNPILTEYRNHYCLY